MDTATLNLRWGQRLVDGLVQGGVRHFVIAPGARSTPLVAAVDGHPGAHSTVITDERVAAFVALGMGLAQRRPAALITTSGSAIAHAHPAVIEAAAAGHPLLVISADRPPELHDVGANQATPQVDLFRAHASATVALPTPEWALLPALDGAIAHALWRAERGPVHLNCPLRKPLIAPDDPAHAPGREVVEWASERDFTPRARDAFQRGLAATRRGVLVVGALPDEGARATVRAFAARLGWPVFADVCSGVTGLPHAGLLLADPALRAALEPDTVLHVGGRIVSAELEAWLSAARPARAWVVEPGDARYDPAQTVTARFRVELGRALDATPAVAPHPSLRELAERAEQVAARVAAILDDLGACAGPAAARAIWQSDDAPLVIGNSTPVRDFEAYRPATARIAHASRGVSGIDGTVSTALGWALAQGAPAVVALGDQALIHDLGALVTLAATGAPLTVVVLNNDGGAIFDQLAVASRPALLARCFVAPHGLTFGGLAAAFGLPYVRCMQPAELRAALAAGAGPRLIEVVTDRARDAALRAHLARSTQPAQEAP